MPFIETDMLFAFLNINDRHHDMAAKIFTSIEAGSRIDLPSSVFIEMELIYKSEGRDGELTSHIVNLLSFKGLNPIPLTPEIVLLAISLREEYDLSFFDSHHVSTALQGDGKLISTDKAFRNIKGLQLIRSQDFSVEIME